MARETKAERAERERLEQERQNAENAEFLAGLPMLVLNLMARVQKRHDARAHVYESEGLVRVEFTFDSKHDGEHYDREVNVYLQTDYDWRLRDSVEDVVRELDQRDAADAEAARLRKVAQDAYDALNDEQRKALGLNRRP